MNSGDEYVLINYQVFDPNTESEYLKQHLANKDASVFYEDLRFELANAFANTCWGFDMKTPTVLIFQFCEGMILRMNEYSKRSPYDVAFSFCGSKSKYTYYKDDVLELAELISKAIFAVTSKAMNCANSPNFDVHISTSYYN